MKKFFIAVILLVAFSVTAQSCTDDTAQEEVEVYSPDKDTCPPGGCPK